LNDKKQLGDNRRHIRVFDIINKSFPDKDHAVFKFNLFGEYILAYTAIVLVSGYTIYDIIAGLCNAIIWGKDAFGNLIYVWLITLVLITITFFACLFFCKKIKNYLNPEE